MDRKLIGEKGNVKPERLEKTGVKSEEKPGRKRRRPLSLVENIKWID